MRSPQHSENTRLTSLPGRDDIGRLTLPNGITVLTRENFNSPSVFISGYLQAGGITDSDEKLGLADFTASSLMRGTARRSMQQIYELLESCGASLSFGAGVHTTGFSGRALIEDLPLLLELTSEILQQPAFPAEQVEKLRAQILTGLALRAQDTADMASLTFDQILFKGHPYERPDEGWPETVQAITTGDLADFHRRAYGPRGMVIAITGAIKARQAFDWVDRLLGGWTNDDTGRASRRSSRSLPRRGDG